MDLSFTFIEFLCTHNINIFIKWILKCWYFRLEWILKLFIRRLDRLMVFISGGLCECSNKNHFSALLGEQIWTSVYMFSISDVYYHNFVINYIINRVHRRIDQGKIWFREGCKIFSRKFDFYCYTRRWWPRRKDAGSLKNSIISKVPMETGTIAS